MTNSFSEFSRAKMFLVIGSNMTEAHPVATTFLKNAVMEGAKLIVVDPRRHRLYHYHTRTQTGRCEGLNDLLGEETADISFADANLMGIENGEKIRVKSRRVDDMVYPRVFGIDEKMG